MVMTAEIEFVEFPNAPLCPHCEAALEQIAFRKEKVTFAFMKGFAWAIILICPHCQKVVGTQSWH
jgi:hypothetical protein